MRRGTHRADRTLAALAFVAVGALLLGACGSSSATTTPPSTAPATPPSTSDQALPVPQTTAFGRDVFGSIPTLPQVQAVSQVERKKGVTSRTYESDTLSPKRAVESYDTLVTDAGWVQVYAPYQVGTSSWRARYTQQHYQLQVSTVSAPSLDPQRQGTIVTQVSVQLYAPGTNPLPPPSTVASR